MDEIAINGRFLAAPQSGVQRVARELLLALDAEAPDALARRMRLVAPEAADAPPLSRIAIRRIGGGAGTLWEQTRFALDTVGALRVNLANTAPLIGDPGVVMIHDAQVWIAPDSYSRAFRVWYRVMQPRVASRARALLTVSGFSADALAEIGLGERRATVLHNGVDHILRAPRGEEGLRPPAPYALAVASDQPHKNTELLLRAFEDDRLDGLTLALVGAWSGPTPSGVVQLGRVDDAMLRRLYEDAAMFLFPSRTEGFGLLPGEAMACGCPVLAARAGALPEVYGDALDLLDPDEPEAWIEAIHALWLDAGRRREAVARGLRRAAALSWRVAGERLAGVIEGVVEARAGGSAPGIGDEHAGEHPV